MSSLIELAALFLRFGVIGFGGPAVHIAMMEEEVVQKRQWLSREHFLDLVGATNLIPGPNSTEMAMHVGYVRAGWLGLIVAGGCFICPAVLITAALAWVYVRFGSLPEIAPFLSGIKPAVLAILVGAMWRLGRTAVKRWELAVVGLAVAAGTLLGANEIAALFAGGLLGMMWLRLSETAKKRNVAGAVEPVSLWALFLFFLKIGGVLYGSGYVLIAFLERGLVHDLGWLTSQQLLDAVAVGQFTPGPVLSTATFIGYVVSGGAGATLATVGIFLPSFVFVAALNPVVPRLRKSRWMSAFLDAVNVSAVALMVAITISLTRATLTNPTSIVIAVVAAVVALRWKKTNPAWLVLGGAIAGWLSSLVLGHS